MISRIRQQRTRRTKILARRMQNAIPSGGVIALADEAKLDRSLLKGWRVRSFPERDGQYWDPPENDPAAIAELDRMQWTGAHYVVVAWPAFWWLSHYADFNRHLRDTFDCIFEDDLFVVFDVRS